MNTEAKSADGIGLLIGRVSNGDGNRGHRRYLLIEDVHAVASRRTALLADDEGSGCDTCAGNIRPNQELAARVDDRDRLRAGRWRRHRRVAVSGHVGRRYYGDGVAVVGVRGQIAVEIVVRLLVLEVP